MKKVTLLNVILGLIIVVLISVSFSFFNNNTELKKENAQLKSSLKSANETGVISGLTKDFIEESSAGKQKDLLTGEAKQNYEKALSQKPSGVSQSGGDQLLNGVDIVNVFVKKDSKNTATSYAIYQLSYKYSQAQPNSFGTQRILYLTLKANWEKVNGSYKVSQYKIGLLTDNLDNYLKQTHKESVYPNGQD